jgi:hypothetical protein
MNGDEMLIKYGSISKQFPRAAAALAETLCFFHPNALSNEKPCSPSRIKFAG